MNYFTCFRFLILIFILIPFLDACPKEPPPMDPNKPVYQNVIPGLFGIGGVWKKVKPLSKEELRQIHKEEFTLRNKQKTFDRGLLFFSFGLPGAIIGFLLNGFLKQYSGQMFAHIFSIGGVGLTGAGIIMMEWAETPKVVTWCIAALIAYVVLSCILKDKGIEFKMPKRLSKLKKRSKRWRSSG